MPRPCMCLNLRRTGRTPAERFLNAADRLEFRRGCGLGRLSVPNRARVEAVKRIGRPAVTCAGHNARPGHAHEGAGTRPGNGRYWRRRCTRGDVRSRYRSYDLYCTRSMKSTVPWQATRVLIDGHDRTTGAEPRTVLPGHRRAIIERFEADGARAKSIGNVPSGCLVWFTHTARLQYVPKPRVRPDACPQAVGLPSVRTIAMRSGDPARVLGPEAKALDTHLAGGRYRLDPGCGFFLRCDALTDEPCTLMCEKPG